jgi:hypothetical protein
MMIRWSPKPGNWNRMPLCDKIKSYMTQHLDHRYAPYVDKIEAKEYVRSVCGDLVLTAEILEIVTDPEAPALGNWFVSPPRAILKATHGSGWNRILDETCTVEHVRSLLQTWGGVYNQGSERQYEHVKPRFFVEELINGGSVWIVMVRCIFGVPVTVGIAHPKSPQQQSSYYSDWTPIATDTSAAGGHLLLLLLPAPELRQTIMEASRRLSAPFEFVRVDFMLPTLCAPPIYFSELTFSPKGGKPLYPKAVEARLGTMW